MDALIAPQFAPPGCAHKKYRELFALIVSECESSTDKLAPLREQFEATEPPVAAQVLDAEQQKRVEPQ